MSKFLMVAIATILGSAIAMGVYYLAFELIVDDGTAINQRRLYTAILIAGVGAGILSGFVSWIGLDFVGPSGMVALLLSPLVVILLDSGSWDSRMSKALFCPALMAAVGIGLLFHRSSKSIAPDNTKANSIKDT